VAVSGGTVVVQPGETLFALSRRTGVELRDLISANGLEPPYALRSGQRLTIPAARYHVVQPGETGYAISRAYGVDLTALARLNDLAAPYGVRIGQRLRLPASGSAAPDPITTSGQALASTGEAAPGSVAKTGPATATPAPIPRPGSFAGRFTWPVEGRVISGYGPKAGGLHNDGINIAVNRGTTVRAAADGVVAYASDGLAGFGWLLLIKHGDGWVTAYAHNQELLVSRGDTVRQGDPVARAGATGAVDRPQLHFEIRRGRQAMNPTQYLPQRAAS
jgi:murein DD-endopeptidase MepM/ murein hydrolase activator NlpD